MSLLFLFFKSQIWYKGGDFDYVIMMFLIQGDIVVWRVLSKWIHELKNRW